ncbi:MAG: prepilin-type N-terminal cleavage/methylation domain-containing protein [Aquificae bacterium]|nr:prepilin-type N-terminal cleavage/methylation domain-containing protein [Aquificota bacterium]
MKRAFTVIELLVVAAIIVIVAFGVLINFQKIYREYKFNEYAFLTEALVRTAKAYAMERTTNVNVCLDGREVKMIDVGTERTVNCSGSLVNSLLIEESYVNITGSSVGFDPRGFALRMGSFCLDNGSRYVRISVSRWGAIRIEEGTGTCS